MIGGGGGLRREKQRKEQEALRSWACYRAREASLPSPLPLLPELKAICFLFLATPQFKKKELKSQTTNRTICPTLHYQPWIYSADDYSHMWGILLASHGVSCSSRFSIRGNQKPSHGFYKRDLYSPGRTPSPHGEVVVFIGPISWLRVYMCIRSEFVFLALGKEKNKTKYAFPLFKQRCT